MKLILFDLDGVLVDTVTMHYNALNVALDYQSSKYIITSEERQHYEGKKTEDKLAMLTDVKGLPAALYHDIKKMKDEVYQSLLETIKPNDTITNICNELLSSYELGVCSNSNGLAVQTCLKMTGLTRYFSLTLSSDDIVNPKPNSEIYLKAMQMANVDPSDVLIIEDSPQGVEAAYKSGAHVLTTDYDKISLQQIYERIPR